MRKRRKEIIYMEHRLEEIKTLIQEAEMVLVGIGTEFVPVFEAEDKEETLIPYYKSQFFREIPQNHEVIQAYDRLRELIGVKPYFVVNLNTDDLIYRSAIEQDLIVCPCGSMAKMQCGEHIVEAEAEVSAVLENKNHQPVCPVCGAPLQFHTIETENYMESGYLPQWNHYQRWLSCTINRKLCILELGAGFEFPQVMRWPFEKVTVYNRKAHLIRVGTRFPQIPEEIAERGISIQQSPIQFLLNF